MGNAKVCIEGNGFLFGFGLPEEKIVDIQRAQRGADVAIYFKNNTQRYLYDCTTKRDFSVHPSKTGDFVFGELEHRDSRGNLIHKNYEIASVKTQQWEKKCVSNELHGVIIKMLPLDKHHLFGRNP